MNFMITIQAQQGFSGTCMHFLKFNRCLCGLCRCWCWAYLVRSLIVGDCSQSKPMHQLSTCRCVFSFDLLPCFPRKDTYEGREILRKCVWTCGLACVRASDAILSWRMFAAVAPALMSFQKLWWLQALHSWIFNGPNWCSPQLPFGLLDLYNDIKKRPIVRNKLARTIVSHDYYIVLNLTRDMHFE